MNEYKEQKIYLPEPKDNIFKKIFRRHPLFWIVFLLLVGCGIMVFGSIMLLTYIDMNYGINLALEGTLLIIFLGAAIFAKCMFHFGGSDAYAFVKRDGIFYVVSQIRLGEVYDEKKFNTKEKREANYSEKLDEILKIIKRDPNSYYLKPNCERTFLQKLFQDHLEGASLGKVYDNHDNAYDFLKLNHPVVIKKRLYTFKIRFLDEHGKYCDAKFSNYYEGLFDEIPYASDENLKDMVEDNSVKKRSFKEVGILILALAALMVILRVDTVLTDPRYRLVVKENSEKIGSYISKTYENGESFEIKSLHASRTTDYKDRLKYYDVSFDCTFDNGNEYTACCFVYPDGDMWVIYIRDEEGFLYSYTMDEDIDIE